MKIVIQRVQSASVVIEDSTVGAIKQGLLLLVGVGPEDTKEDLEYAVRKIVNMRIFSDEDGKMNLSVKDIGGQILSVSQFTLFADTKKGNRPAFTGAAKPDVASQFYDDFNQSLSAHVPVERGRFGADMQVSLINDGPVTVILTLQHASEIIGQDNVDITLAAGASAKVSNLIVASGWLTNNTGYLVTISVNDKSGAVLSVEKD